MSTQYNLISNVSPYTQTKAPQHASNLFIVFFLSKLPNYSRSHSSTCQLLFVSWHTAITASVLLLHLPLSSRVLHHGIDRRMRPRDHFTVLTDSYHTQPTSLRMCMHTKGGQRRWRVWPLRSGCSTAGACHRRFAGPRSYRGNCSACEKQRGSIQRVWISRRLFQAWCH